MTDMQMSHKCTLDQNHSALQEYSQFQKCRLISYDNPQRQTCFRSDAEVRKEQERHISINRRVIHPFSKFRLWYEVYLIYLYGSLLISKPMDSAFMKQESMIYDYGVYTIFTDILCLVDVFMTFFTGYDQQAPHQVELRMWPIARRYIFGPHFILDLASSVNRAIVYMLTMENKIYNLYGVVAILSFMKIGRLFSFLRCVRRSAEYFGMKARGTRDLLNSLILTLLILHWMTCFQFAIPRLFRRLFYVAEDTPRWYRVSGVRNKGIPAQYVHGFFRSAAYILSIRLNLYPTAAPEEYWMAVINYLIGKILVAFVWIVLALEILKSRSVEIKFARKIDQLNAYLKHKRVPLNLRNRVFHYYDVKFQGKYLKETMITNIISDGLREEIDYETCGTLLRNVALLCDMSPADLKNLVKCLVLEIYMPHDTIIKSGSLGDTVFFLLSGTVAVYTRSGKEVCHLQDGAFFGELCLVLKQNMRLTDVEAIEYTYIYKLKRKDFEKYLLNNTKARDKIIAQAQTRLTHILRLEEEYKKKLYGANPNL